MKWKQFEASRQSNGKQSNFIVVLTHQLNGFTLVGCDIFSDLSSRFDDETLTRMMSKFKDQSRTLNSQPKVNEKKSFGVWHDSFNKIMFRLVRDDSSTLNLIYSN